MITPPAGVRVYLACGYTDMRKGMTTLAMLVQQALGHDPFQAGVVYAFRGRRGGLKFGTTALECACLSNDWNVGNSSGPCRRQGQYR
jgi:transposase